MTRHMRTGEEECCASTISSAAHTAPHRLSALSGEKRNQLGDFGDRNSKLENPNSQIAQLSYGPIARLILAMKNRGPTRQVRAAFALAWSQSRLVNGSVYNERLVWRIRSKGIW